MHSVSYEYTAVVPLASDSTMVNLDHAKAGEYKRKQRLPCIVIALLSNAR